MRRRGGKRRASKVIRNGAGSAADSAVDGWPPSRDVIPGGSVDGYYAFMLVATALVLMMTVPALALFYGGMSLSLIHI